jgi:hypothetical protein
MDAEMQSMHLLRLRACVCVHFTSDLLAVVHLQDGVTRSRKRPATRSLPDWALTPESSVFLNIPMDAETPSMRLLRPQALVQEEAIRYWATTTAYRCGAVEQLLNANFFLLPDLDFAALCCACMSWLQPQALVQ